MRWAAGCALTMLCGTAQAQTNLTANVNGCKVELTWDLPEGMQDQDSQGFETEAFPGDEWTVRSTNTSDYRCSWFSYPTSDFTQFENYKEYIHQGERSAMVYMDMGKHTDGSSANQDEWLISPLYSRATYLEFYSYIDPKVLEYDGYEGYDDHYYVKLSRDGGETWEVIWDARTSCSPEGGWQLVSLPLGEPSENMRIAFNAVSGSAKPEDHLYFLWAIDDVRVSSSAAAAKAAPAVSYGYYNVYFNNELLATELNTRSYVDLSDKVEGTHTYRVTYMDKLTDQESEGASVQVQIYAPTFDAPRNVKLTCREDSEEGYVASLTWDEPEGHQKPEGYIVYCNGMWVAYGITETNFENTGLTKGVYEYAVSAMYDNPWGESEAVGGVIAIGTRMPVQNLQAQLVGNEVSLTWQAPNDSQHAVKAYRVYRSTMCVAQDLTECNFTDKQVPQGCFDYTVIAVYEDGEESMASAVSVENGEMPVTPLPFAETFDTPFKPANWQVENLFEYTEDSYIWRFDDWFEMNLSGEGFSGCYASIDGISAGWSGIMANLVTPLLDSRHAEGTQLLLSYDLDFLSFYGDCEGRLEYSTDRGQNWVTLEQLAPYSDTDLAPGEASRAVHMKHDVTQLAQTDAIQFRWYYSGNMDGHIAIDNVRLEQVEPEGIAAVTTADQGKVSVYNLQGVKLLEAENEADIPALPAGVYIFEQNGHSCKRMFK